MSLFWPYLQKAGRYLALLLFFTLSACNGPAPTPGRLNGCSPQTLDVVFTQTQSLPELGLENTVFFSGSVPLKLQGDLLTGEAELPLHGSGQAGSCEWQNSGSVYYRVSGRLTQAPDGTYLVTFTPTRRMDLRSNAGEGCPQPPAGEPVSDPPLSLLFADQARAQNSWDASASGTHTSLQLKLHLDCSPQD